MVRKMNLDGTTRKALVAAIEGLTGEKAVYRRMPTCNYDIGDITVLKDGSVNFPDVLDIIERLAGMGFKAEPEQTALTVGNDGDETAAYTAFVTALVDMVKRQKRITATEKEVSNEKYTFRCFLLRLGFVGDEYKTARKILLRNLTGSSAFKSGQKGDTRVMKYPSKETIERLRGEYPIGCRVELMRMDDVQAPPIGTKGTVKGVDDIGSIMIDWDNGCGLSAAWGEDVVRRVLGPEKPDDTEMAVCPRCGRTYSEPPAISRVDNETPICPDCGTREALESIGVRTEEQDSILEIIHRATGNLR